MHFPVWLSDKKDKLKRILALVFLSLSLTLVTFIVLMNWQQLQSYPWQFHVAPLIKGVIFFPLGALPSAFAWHFLVEELGEEKGLCRNLEVYALSSLPRRLPGIIWYVGTRVYLYKEIGEAAIVTLGATLCESVGLTVSGLSVYLASLLLSGADRVATLVDPRIVLLIILASMSFLAAIALVVKAGRNSGLKWLAPIGQMRWSIALGILITYMWSWCAGGMFFFFFLRTISPIRAEVVVTIVGIWAASGAIGQLASVIQGLGLKEVGMVALLTIFLPLSVAVLVSLVTRVVHTLLEAGVMLVLWFLSHNACKAKQEVT